MAEIISGYSLSDIQKNISINRKDFYDAVIINHTNGIPETMAVDIIDVFIFNSYGEVIVQKRSHNKRHNPGLLDKSIGGHVTWGDTCDYTVMVETVQELQTPSIVLRTTEDFDKTYKVLENYFETISIISHADSKLLELNKIIDGKSIAVHNMVHMYFGLYDGRLRPVDREAKGILYYTLDELRKEIDATPQVFSHDLVSFLGIYKDELDSFVKAYCKDSPEYSHKKTS